MGPSDVAAPMWFHGRNSDSKVMLLWSTKSVMCPPVKRTCVDIGVWKSPAESEDERSEVIPTKAKQIKAEQDPNSQFFNTLKNLINKAQAANCEGLVRAVNLDEDGTRLAQCCKLPDL